VNYEWQDSYSIGIESLDLQHKSLFYLCSEAEHCLHAEGRDAIAEFHDILYNMWMFADEHFKAEEKLLYVYGYPALVEHQNEHERYLESLTEFLVMATSGVIDKHGVNDFLRNWWLQHILVDDMAFKGVFRGKDNIVNPYSDVDDGFTRF